EQVGAVVVLLLEHPANEREPVRVHTSGRETDDRVSFLHAGAVDQIVALDEPDAGAGEVQLSLAIDAGQLGGLTPDQGAARLPADAGGPLDELGDLVEIARGRPPVIHAAEPPRPGP